MKKKSPRKYFGNRCASLRSPREPSPNLQLELDLPRVNSQFFNGAQVSNFSPKVGSPMSSYQPSPRVSVYKDKEERKLPFPRKLGQSQSEMKLNRKLLEAVKRYTGQKTRSSHVPLKSRMGERFSQKRLGQPQVLPTNFELVAFNIPKLIESSHFKANRFRLPSIEPTRAVRTDQAREVTKISLGTQQTESPRKSRLFDNQIIQERIDTYQDEFLPILAPRGLDFHSKGKRRTPPNLNSQLLSNYLLLSRRDSQKQRRVKLRRKGMV